MESIKNIIFQKAREGIFNNNNELNLDIVESIRNLLPYMGEWTSDEIK
jgi:hypothetical protein